MKVKLYAIPASHSALAARLMLERKRLEHRLVRLLAGLHPLRLRLAGFKGGTVPALKIDGRRVQGTLAISRALEELQPEQPLFPPEAAKRERVVRAERWGHDELQPVPRRLIRWAVVRDRRVRREIVELNHLPFAALSTALIKPAGAYFRRKSGAYDDAVRRDLRRLPHLLDHVDELIAQGTLDTAELNAAEAQIAPSVRLLMNFDDLRPWIEHRPAGSFARRVVPAYPGHVPPVFPATWLGVAPRRIERSDASTRRRLTMPERRLQ